MTPASQLRRQASRVVALLALAGGLVLAWRGLSAPAETAIAHSLAAPEEVGLSRGNEFGTPRDPEAAPDFDERLAPPLAPRPADERFRGASLAEGLPMLPGGRAWINVGNEMQANGVSMQLAAYEIDREAPAILEWYAKMFDQRGWPWLGLQQTAKLVPYPALSATDLERGLQWTVMVMEHRLHKGGPQAPERMGATVLVGMADMRNIAPPAAELGDLPVYPGSRPSAVRARDPEFLSRTVQFVTEDPPERVEAFYRAQLPAKGYRKLEAEQPESSSPGRQMRFASEARSWNLTLLARGAGTSVVASSREREATP